MNTAQRDAIQQIIGNHADNLYRYELSERQKPGQVTGNGQPFTEIIASLKAKIATLKENL